MGARLASFVAAIAVAVWALFVRLRRSSFTKPVHVGASGLLVSTNVMVDLYAARVPGGVVLFDTGIDPSGKMVDALLAAVDATRTDVTDVFLTHAHPDHVGAAHLFGETRIHAGAADLPYYERSARWSRPAVRAFEAIVGSPRVRPSHLLVGVSAVPVGDGTESVQAFPMPGDTPGAYAFVFRGALIAGDGLVRRDGELTLSPSWTMEDPPQNRRSVRELVRATRALDLAYVCSSHGGFAALDPTHAELEALAGEAASIDALPARAS